MNVTTVTATQGESIISVPVWHKGGFSADSWQERHKDCELREWDTMDACRWIQARRAEGKAV